jgi:trehalose-6-phosphate synthase
MQSRERLVVVSNRLPVTLHQTGTEWRAERSTGGLASAMNPILKQSDGIWIGWPGESEGIGDPKRQEILDRWAERDSLISVDLAPDLAKKFYEGYANQTLWPLFHYFLTRVVFDRDAWTAYVRANQLFCDMVVRHHHPEVWRASMPTFLEAAGADNESASHRRSPIGGDVVRHGGLPACERRTRRQADATP